MKVPYYLLASALCLTLALGACSDGPTDVSNEAALSAQDAGAAAKKQDKYDICHYDADANGSVGGLIHLNVNGNAWSGGGEGCGGKVNGSDKKTGHNGHEMDRNWNSDTTFVATACEAWCFEDRDGDGWTDDQDNCIDTYNPGQEDVVHPDGVGDACDDPDADGVFDDVDNCPDTDNPGQEDIDGDGIGDACDSCTDVDGDTYCDEDFDCDDSDAAINPDATEICDDFVDNDCNGDVDLADSFCTI